MKNIPHRGNRISGGRMEQGVFKEERDPCGAGMGAGERQKPREEEMEKEGPKLSRDLVGPSSPVSSGLR